MPSATSNRALELSLQAAAGRPGIAELMKEMLLRTGVSLQDIIESKTEDAVRVSVYLRSLKKARLMQKNLKRFHLKKITVRLRSLQKRDWKEKWKRDLSPFALTKNIDVVPAWCQKKYKTNRRASIIIDTVNAFGTGQHETTRFMAQFIERCRGRFLSFFDVGTGTGILSLVAFKCGACEVAGVDINADSVKVARWNLSVNGYHFGMLESADLEKFRSRKKYDFVAANLITDKLIKMRRKILFYVKPGKYLAVSGINLTNLTRLRREFKGLPLRCLKIQKGKDWAAVLYKRIP